ncbi:conserved hypothetical protein [Ricinus communis]|uniref:Uncharacterized protein n=1 Tax=Ricinus communis TaxID=3988 RepID=B9S284_RICCO|nr:conserved hypothetical protein [Ricinus communis]
MEFDVFKLAQDPSMQHPQDLLEACLIHEVESDDEALEVVAYNNTLNAQLALPHRQSLRYESLPRDLFSINALREEDAPNVELKQLPPNLE